MGRPKAPCTSTVLNLDGPRLPTRAWTRTSPKGATDTDVRLVQPRSQGAVVAESISLERSDKPSVPLVFLSESPGKIRVSFDLRVSYDPPSTAPLGATASPSSASGGRRRAWPPP